MKVTIEHYIATNNPNAAQALLEKYRVPAAKSMADLIKKLHYIVAKHRDVAVLDLATIETPYKKLMVATQKTVAPIIQEAAKVVNETPVIVPTPAPTPASEVKSNACGCSGFDGEEKSNCSGCGGKCGMSNATGNKPAATETKPAATATETKTENTPAKSDDKMEKYMPLVVLGVVGLIAVVVIAKK